MTKSSNLRAAGATAAAPAAKSRARGGESLNPVKQRKPSKAGKPSERGSGGLEELRQDVFEGQPEAERAYHETHQRAQLAAGLKFQRRRAGLTLRQLAAEAGWSPSYVSRLESATGPWPKIDSILRYLSACGSDARCGLVIGQPTAGGFRIDSATTISDGQEEVFEGLAGRSVATRKA
jgi:transcriptional regulator with XRE-family HTH domain